MNRRIKKMKPRKIAIAGVGHVGAHVASSLATQGICDEIILIDKDQQKVASEVQDLRDSMLWMADEVKINAGTFEDLADCDILINSTGNIALLKENNDRTNELAFNTQSVSTYTSLIKNSGFSGIIINITNPCDVITRQIAQETGLPKGHVFGTGTCLDTSRLIKTLSQETGISEQSITAYMMGEHGNKQFAPRSTVSFRGFAPETFHAHKSFDWDAVTKDAVQGGWVTFAGKFCTEYGIAATAARLAKAVLRNENIILPVSAPLDGEYGQSGLFAGVPCRIDKDGAHVVEIPLTKEELETFDACCQTIKENIKTAQNIKKSHE